MAPIAMTGQVVVRNSLWIGFCFMVLLPLLIAIAIWIRDVARSRDLQAASVRAERLRSFSLDEPPQLVNVIQGRMSLVGPRPHAVAHNELYRRLMDGYMVRHKVLPGIAGLAQVRGLRGETQTLEQTEVRVRCDLEFLRNWSVGLDLQILARTALRVWHDRAAF